MTVLEAERKARSWSQTVLAFHAQLSQSDVSKMERGRALPTAAQADRLSRVLGVPPEALLRQVRDPREAVVRAAGAGRG